MNMFKVNKTNFSIASSSVVIFFVFNIVLCPIALFPETASGTGKNKTASAQEAVSGDKKAVVEKGEERKGLPGREYTEEEFKPQVGEESYGWLVFKTIIILGLLVGGFYYFFRFVTQKAGVQVMGQDVFQVLSIAPIGQNKYLQVVDMAGKILVLGISESSVNLIMEIKDKEEIDRIRLVSSRAVSVQRKGFQEMIAHQVGGIINRVAQGRGGKSGTLSSKEDFDSSVDLSYLKRQKNRLKKLNGFEDD